MTVTVGNAKVGVAGMVGVNVIVGVSMTVGVNVGGGVKVDVGVSVHAAAVAVMDVAVKANCSSGEGPQAVLRHLGLVQAPHQVQGDDAAERVVDCLGRGEIDHGAGAVYRECGECGSLAGW